MRRVEFVTAEVLSGTTWGDLEIVSASMDNHLMVTQRASTNAKKQRVIQDQHSKKCWCIKKNHSPLYGKGWPQA